MDEQIKTDDVLKRVALAAGVSPTELSDVLFVSPRTIKSWRARNTLPMTQLVTFATERGVSLDYLLLGRREEPQRIDRWVLRNVLDGIENSAAKKLGVFGNVLGGLTAVIAIVYERIAARGPLASDEALQSLVSEELDSLGQALAVGMVTNAEVRASLPAERLQAIERFCRVRVPERQPGAASEANRADES